MGVGLGVRAGVGVGVPDGVAPACGADDGMAVGRAVRRGVGRGVVAPPGVTTTGEVADEIGTKVSPATDPPALCSGNAVETAESDAGVALA